MSTRTITTSDHAEITSWVERHGGVPCRVRGDDGVGGIVLRIDFPNRVEELEPLDWDHWFAHFDDAHLALTYQLDPADSSNCTFTELIHR